MEIGAYNVDIWESNRDGYCPVIIDLFDGDDWVGRKRVYVRNTMTYPELTRLIKSNGFIVAQFFEMVENQKVTLVKTVNIIKHR